MKPIHTKEQHWASLTERERSEATAHDKSSPIAVYPRLSDYERALSDAGVDAHYLEAALGPGATVKGFAFGGRRHFYAPCWRVDLDPGEQRYIPTGHTQNDQGIYTRPDGWDERIVAFVLGALTMVAVAAVARMFW